jgi:hypothetical protein
MNYLLLFSFSAAAMFLADSMHFNSPTTLVHTDNSELKLVESSVSAAPFWVKNSSVYYKNEIFELHFAAPNARYLGVLDPSGHFFYLVYPKEQAMGDLYPIVESSDFVLLTSLKIRPDGFCADPYKYGICQNQPVFTQSGKYTFILGENLHVDDPSELNQVIIEYLHQNSPIQIKP